MNRLLLDTCTLIRWAVEPALIKDEAKFAIASGRSLVYVNSPTTWEMATKRKLGQLKPTPSVVDLIREEQFIELPISIADTQATTELPLMHRAPFDCFLVAQTRTEAKNLVTSDSEIQKYDVAVLTA